MRPTLQGVRSHPSLAYDQIGTGPDATTCTIAQSSHPLDGVQIREVGRFGYLPGTVREVGICRARLQPLGAPVKPGHDDTRQMWASDGHDLRGLTYIVLKQSSVVGFDGMHHRVIICPGDRVHHVNRHSGQGVAGDADGMA
jgi:hypothetical protein